MTSLKMLGFYPIKNFWIKSSINIKKMLLLPTNSVSCVLMIPFKDYQFKTKRWNPNLDDLIADDWYVYGEANKFYKRYKSS